MCSGNWTRGEKEKVLPSGSFQSHREWGPKTEVKIDHKPHPGGESREQEPSARELVKATSLRAAALGQRRSPDGGREGLSLTEGP